MSRAEFVPAPRSSKRLQSRSCRNRITALVARATAPPGVRCRPRPEQNRLELGHNQRELSHALIEQHRPAFS